MKLDLLDTNDYLIYLNGKTFSDLDFSNEEDIVKQTKEVVMKLKNIYNIKLSGFYQMIIYVGDGIGLFIELKKLDELDFGLMTIDLKVIVYLHQTFLMKSIDFDNIKCCQKIFVYNNCFYGVLSNNSSVLILEMGEIIYGREVDLVLKKGRMLRI